MRELYRRLFRMPEYGKIDKYCAWRYAFAHQFIQKATAPDASILDLGAGRGNLRDFLLEKETYLAVDLENYTAGGSSPAFMKLDLTVPRDAYMLGKFQFSFLACLDVLEHLPKKALAGVIWSMSSAAPFAAVTVANHSDVWLGRELHLVQEPKPYWDDLLGQVYDIVHSETVHDGRLYAYQLRAKLDKPVFNTQAGLTA